MLVTRETIREYLPQKDPIVMVDGILENSDTELVSCFTPNEHTLFSLNGYFTESGLIENMAQTAAAKAGYTARQNNLEPLVGFIGAVKNLRIFFLPPIGTELKTSLRITGEVMNVTLATVSVNSSLGRVAECELKIFLQQPA